MCLVKDVSSFLKELSNRQKFTDCLNDDEKNLMSIRTTIENELGISSND